MSERTEAAKIPRPKGSLFHDEDEEHPQGSVSRKRFAAVFTVASTTLVISAITFFGIGMVLGASLGPGMGGFVAQFDNVSYTEGDANIYPVLGSHPACADAPQLEANLAGTTYLMGNVTFYKDMPLPDSSFAPEQMARISIVANSGGDRIAVEDLNLRLSALNSDRLNFDRTVVREFGPNQYENQTSPGPSDSLVPEEKIGSLNPDTAPNSTVVPEYGIDAESFILPDGGTAAAHQVLLGSISLQNLDLFVAIDDKSDFSNPVERVVQPDNRTCESLAKSTQ